MVDIQSYYVHIFFPPLSSSCPTTLEQISWKFTSNRHGILHSFILLLLLLFFTKKKKKKQSSALMKKFFKLSAVV